MYEKSYGVTVLRLKRVGQIVLRPKVLLKMRHVGASTMRSVRVTHSVILTGSPECPRQRGTLVVLWMDVDEAASMLVCKAENLTNHHQDAAFHAAQWLIPD